jgi:hypothetical protein
MESNKFAYIWQYTVDDMHKGAFLAAYDSTGLWTQLFLRDESYLETILLVDDTNPNRYVTIDYWTSKAARNDFRSKYRSEFEELDRQCEEFTSTEDFIGDFDIVGSSDA